MCIRDRVNSVSYNKTSLDSNGGAVVAELSGVGFTQVDALKAKVYKVNPEGTCLLYTSP